MSSFAVQKHNWRFKAPKLSQQRGERVRTIKDHKPVKFSPAKLSDTSQEHSFVNYSTLHLEKEASRGKSPRQNLEGRNNLTFLSNSSENQQVLTYIMKDGSISKKNSCMELNHRDSCRDSHYRSHDAHLLQETKESFLRFRMEVLKQLKQYEFYIHEEITKIREMVNLLVTSQKEACRQETARNSHDLSTCTLQSEMANIDQLKNQRKLQLSKSAGSLAFVPESKESNGREKEIENKLSKCLSKKIQLIETKPGPSFDKFFQIMQKLRDTIERSVSPKRESNILREKSNLPVRS